MLFTVITWELSHQSLPAGGIEAPQEVATGDGWMATVDNRTTGPVMVIHDVANLDTNWELMNGSIDFDSPYALSGSKLAVANLTTVSIFNLDSIGLTGEAILTIPVEKPDAILLTGAEEVEYIILEKGGLLSAYDMNGDEVPLGFNVDNIELSRAHGLEIAMVLEDKPTSIVLSRIGSSGSITIEEINASSTFEEDEILALWGTPVDMQNATITDFVFDENFIAVTVNVSATERLVVYNRSNDQQWLVSNAKYAVSDPSMKNGILAWSVRDHLDPTNPLEKYMDGEIQFVNLTNNHTQLLTSDAVHQWSPHVLEHHLVYFEQSSDGEVTLHIHSWVPEITPYSNVILQIGIIIGVLLVFTHVVQRQSESRRTIFSYEEE